MTSSRANVASTAGRAVHLAQREYPWLANTPLIVIAAVCGNVGKALAGGARGGLVVSIALGFIGALFGPWLARALNLSEPFVVRVGGQTFPIVWSIIGAALFVALLHLVTGRRWIRA